MVGSCDYGRSLCDLGHVARKKLRIGKKSCNYGRVQAIITETTAENLKALRTDRELNQDDLALILGVPRNAISKIETGTRQLSESEKKILDWYFFGTIPERLPSAVLSADMLDFTAAEWNVISSIARRIGVSPSKWIVDQIRAWLVREELRKPPRLQNVAEDASGNGSFPSTNANTARTNYPVGSRRRGKKNGTES